MDLLDDALELITCSHREAENERRNEKARRYKDWIKAYWDMKNDAEYQKASEAGRNLEVTLSLDNGHVIVHRYWVDEEGCLCETLPHDGEEDSHTVSFHMKGGHEFHCQGSGDDWRKLESNGAIVDLVRALLCESG